VRGTAPWTIELGRFQLSGTPKEDLPVQGGDAAALRLIPGESRRARVRYAIPIYDFAAYNRITQPKGAAVIVGDLKWDVNVTLQDVGALHLHLHEDGVRYEAVIPFGRKEMRAELLKDGMPLHSDRFSGEPGREYRLSFSNVDDRLTLMVDGRRILVHDVAASKGSPNMQGATSAALLEADGAEAVFSRVRLFRDLYYTHPVDRGLDAAWDSPAGPWKVPQGHYLVLGDNTRKSSDSRMWGTIPEEELIGTAVVVWWPLQYLRPFQRE
jgi:hypothetical protein